jgi:hypothetical protein
MRHKPPYWPILALLALILAALVSRLGAQDAPKPAPPPPPTVEQQLAAEKAENAALRKYIADYIEWHNRVATALNSATAACMGNPPQPVPAKEPTK